MNTPERSDSVVRTEDGSIRELAKELCDRARSLIQRPSAQPVDPAAFARHLGIRVITASIADGCGRLFRDRDGWRIVIPQGAVPPRQRWACAHELGHYLLLDMYTDIQSSLARITTNDDELISVEEKLCDYFAQELLLPRGQVKDALDGSHLLLSDFLHLALTWQCSWWATAIRIAELSSDYAFVLATIAREEPRKGLLTVDWTARPRDVFLPRHKAIPPTSCIHKAFSQKSPMASWETKVLGRLRGTRFVEAVPLDRGSGAFAMIHLRDNLNVVQLKLPFVEEAAKHERSSIAHRQLLLRS